MAGLDDILGNEHIVAHFKKAIENNKISQKNIEYDNNILKVLNKHMGDISKDYILLIDKLHDTLQKIYLKS